MTATLVCFGYGYCARALATRLRHRSWQVIGTTRDPASAGTVQHSGAKALIWPGGDATGVLSRATHLLVSIPPDAGGDPVLADLQDGLAAAASRLRWVGYLSTTGVYGDRAGGWVDETTPPAPTTRRGARRVAAETGWHHLANASGLPLHIFRLAGIYGPGRNPLVKLRAGTARRIIKPGQVFSRIHVEDVVSVLMASMARPRPGAIYNVCDDEPAPPQDVLACAAELLGLPVPPAEAFDTAVMTPMARSFHTESKRVRNDRIKVELGVVLRFPDYRAGLRTLVQDRAGQARGVSR